MELQHNLVFNIFLCKVLCISLSWNEAATIIYGNCLWNSCFFVIWCSVHHWLYSVHTVMLVLGVLNAGAVIADILNHRHAGCKNLSFLFLLLNEVLLFLVECHNILLVFVVPLLEVNTCMLSVEYFISYISIQTSGTKVTSLN